MTGINDFENSECMPIVAISPINFNRIWGNEYLLMDSNTFMGGNNGSAYESIIEMFVNIRNENNCRYERLAVFPVCRDLTL